MTDGALSFRMVPGLALKGWRTHLGALGIVAGAVLALFHRDVTGMLSIWWNASTFGHCLFVPILIGWLVQQRSRALRQLRVRDGAAPAPGVYARRRHQLATRTLDRL